MESPDEFKDAMESPDEFQDARESEDELQKAWRDLDRAFEESMRIQKMEMEDMHRMAEAKKFVVEVKATLPHEKLLELHAIKDSYLAEGNTMTEQEVIWEVQDLFEDYRELRKGFEYLCRPREEDKVIEKKDDKEKNKSRVQNWM